jgi:hypothetical protein
LLYEMITGNEFQAEFGNIRERLKKSLAGI